VKDFTLEEAKAEWEDRQVMNATAEGVEQVDELRVGVCASSADENQPAWIGLIPAGRFSGRDGRGPYCLEDAAKVIAATQALEMEAGLPIDYDHATDLGAPEGRPAPAAGWIKELAERNGALWGRVEWTQHGAAALATREYRYVSPVFEHDAKGVVVRLLRAALTNNPNLYLKAIAARRHAGAGVGAEVEAGAPDAAEGGAGMQMNELLATLREILALGDEATAEEIVEAAQGLMDAQGGNATTVKGPAGTDPADRMQAVTVEHYQKAARELSVLRAERAREAGERAVEAAMRAGKIVPAQRQWAIEYCTADAEGFRQFIARQPALTLGALELERDPRRCRTNRAGGEGLGGDSTEELTSVEVTICSRLGLRATDYVRRKLARARPDAGLF
jgi:phage I-like protein